MKAQEHLSSLPMQEDERLNLESIHHISFVALFVSGMWQTPPSNPGAGFESQTYTSPFLKQSLSVTLFLPKATTPIFVPQTCPPLPHIP